MHRFAAALIITLIALLPAAGRAADHGTVLLLAETVDEEAMDLLAGLGDVVHHQDDRLVVAMVPSGLLGAPALRSSLVLDRSPWSGGVGYYWAINPAERNARPGEQNKVRVLFRDGYRLLLRAAPEDAERLPRSGWEIARIPETGSALRRMNGHREAAAPASRFGGPIDGMVSELTTANFSATVQALVDFGTRYTYSDEIMDAADWIHTRLAGFGLSVERDEFDISTYTRDNVIATLPGRLYPDEAVYIVAHYDSISEDPYNSAPGADDNGRGTAAVIEAARVLSRYDFERTIIFACFAGEEQGLYGSFAYTADIAGTGRDVVGCINFDMIGYPGTDPLPPDLIIYTNDESTDIAHRLRDASLHYFPDDLEPVVINDGGMSASDHAAFWSRGYPAIFGIEAEPWTADFSPVYHTTGDLPNVMDMEYAADVARAGMAALADLAGPMEIGETRLLSGPGAGPDNPPTVRVFPPEQDAVHMAEFPAYGATGFGVNVAAGRVTGDATDTVLTGAGPGAIYGPHVRGFSADGTPVPGLSFMAYGTNTFGVNVTAGDLDGDGRDEIVTGAGPGAVFGPHVRAFAFDEGSSTVSPLSGVSYFAYATPKWGVNVAAGDVDGDGRDEILTGAGPGSVYGPHVRGWNVDGGDAQPIAGLSFLAYGTNHFGVRVTCGDIDGDGMAELITAPGPSPQFAAHLRAWDFDGSALVELDQVNFFAWPVEQARYGALIDAATDLDGDGLADLAVAPGPDPSVAAPVRVYGFAGGSPSLLYTFEAFGEGMTHGGTLASGRF